MSSAVFAMIVNIVVALLFAATFATFAVSNAHFRRVAWLGLAYAIGALTPASELMVRFTDLPQIFMVTSYGAFVLAFYVTAAALAKFHRRPVPWRTFAALLLASYALRWATWGGPRDDLGYELLYQLPFAVAMLVCAATVWRAPAKAMLDIVIAGAFLISAAHFLTKPLLAHRYGSGATAKDYAGSIYALLSQSITGILLTAVGLTLILMVVRAMLADAKRESESDALSQLLNRRGFVRQADDPIAKARRLRDDVALVMFDLDHFKRINDTYGHAIGDGFIEAFSEILRLCSPPGALIARLGGEEFAVMLASRNAAVARLFGENVRAHLVHLELEQCPEVRITVSAGLAVDRAPLELRDLMKRADAALYEAKSLGRDRLCIAGDRHEAALAAAS
ncbi:MAG: GGDEF domain-containing protein [Xanthobacteraceae bacterium]